jgi:proteic killer suppression protein
MKVRFEDTDLDRLETDQRFTAGFQPSVVTAFRKRMQQIRSAPDERTFYALKSLHFEKLKRANPGEHSMRLNDQWRLIVRFEGEGNNKSIVVVRITDYH